MVGKDNLHPNWAIRVLKKYLCLVYKNTNHNIGEFPIAATAYQITKKDIISKMKFPDWILSQSP